MKFLDDNKGGITIKQQHIRKWFQIVMAFLSVLIIGLTTVEATNELSHNDEIKNYTVLVTAFEKFGVRETNVTEELLKYLPEESDTHQAHIVGEVLPVVYGESGEALRQAIDKHQPDIVISLGESRFEGDIRIDTQAANTVRSGSVDNEGNQYKGKQTVPNGEEILHNTLANSEIVEDLQEQGKRILIQDKTTTYVCNHVFYHLMDYANKTSNIQAAGFIHVDSTTDQSEIKQRADAVLAVIDSQINELETE